MGALLRVQVSERSETQLRKRARSAQAVDNVAALCRELLAMGASAEVARKVGANSRRWWRNSAKLLNSVLTIAWFDRLGLPRLP